jgi:hypothetical protein
MSHKSRVFIAETKNYFGRHALHVNNLGLF